MSVIDWISRVLVIIGGLNWGLIAVSRFNLVTAIFGEETMWTRVVYALVGLGALYEIIRLVSQEPVTARRE